MADLAMKSRSKARVTAATTIQTVKEKGGIIHKILLSNGDAAAQTLTLTDGVTVLNVIRQAAGTSQVYELDCPFATSIKVTPSDADLDALIIYS